MVLIETLWNVKHNDVRYKSNDGYGFNRNIVECKDAAYKNCAPIHDVLIETLWNVKEELNSIDIPNFTVLIETLWNVKEDPEWLSDFVVSFNRNIVECKV